MTRIATSCARRVRSHSARYSGRVRSAACTSSAVLRSLVFICQLLQALCRQLDHASEPLWVGLRFRSHGRNHEHVSSTAVEGSPGASSPAWSQFAEVFTSLYVALVREGQTRS